MRKSIFVIITFFSICWIGISQVIQLPDSFTIQVNDTPITYYKGYKIDTVTIIKVDTVLKPYPVIEYVDTCIIDIPEPPDTTIIEYLSVTASANDGNEPSNVIDGDLSTRWSAQGDGQWIQLNFNERELYGLDIAWFNGATRTSYFDVLTNDEIIIENKSASGEGFKTVKFDGSIITDNIRIVGHTNSFNDWNSILEIRLIEQQIPDDTVIVKPPDTIPGDTVITLPPSGDRLYKIPTFPTAEEYGISKSYYIDGSKSSNGDGSIENPFNQFVDKGNNVAYYIKRGTQIESPSSMGNYVLIDAYGEGDMPKINGSMNFRNYGNHHVILKNLYLFKSGGGFNVRVYENPQGGFYFYRCKIMGDPNSPASFNIYGMKSPAGLLECELGWAVQDNILASDWTDSFIVSCYFHHANRGNSNNGRDPNTTGDAVQFLRHNIKRLYIANNYFDRSDSWWKYCVIFTTAQDGNPSDITFEYNTLISPARGKGGAMLFTAMGDKAKVRGNLFHNWDGNTDVSFLQTYNTIDQPYPYGIYDNVFIGNTDSSHPDFWGATEDERHKIIQQSIGNRIFTNMEEYRQYIESNNIQVKWGSDLNIK